jgi:hypothetical protein
MGGSCRRSGFSALIQCRKFLASCGFFPPGAAIALTVAECALPDAGIWSALFAVDVKSNCHAAAIHERAVLRPVRPYNEALWPALVALWSASVVIVALRLSARHQDDRWVSALLVGHWAWSAVAYHVAFFASINPAAWLFAALFLGQAVLFFGVGVVQRRLSFAPCGNAWAPLAWGLIAYSLAYPAINALNHSSLLRIPTFGLPCPTTIFTAGVLMLATPRCWSLSVGSSDLVSNRWIRSVPARGLR